MSTPTLKALLWVSRVSNEAPDLSREANGSIQVACMCACSCDSASLHAISVIDSTIATVTLMNCTLAVG